MVNGGVACRGSVRTPGEKSISHRAVLFAALAEGTSVIGNISQIEAIETQIEREQLPTATPRLAGGATRA